MKYLATADSLVTDDLITWEIEADTPEEAWNKGFDLARNSDYAEEGSVMVRPLEEDKQAICDKLLETLQLTSNLYDLIYLINICGMRRRCSLFSGTGTRPSMWRWIPARR